MDTLMAENAYARQTFHGKPLDAATIAALKIAEKRLGYELTITQGIGGSVSASAGTHSEGRAVDLSAYDKKRKLRVLKDLGFAVWYRPTIRGLWHEHLHGVLILNNFDNKRGVAGAAHRQITSYIQGRDGLKGDREDNTYRPSPLRAFKYPPKEKPVPPTKTPLANAKDNLVQAAHDLGEAAIWLDRAKRPTKDGKARFSVLAATARGLSRGVTAFLRTLPPK